MEKFLPSDIWRACVLPFLDLACRLDVNQVLPPEARLIKKRTNDEMFANTVAVEETRRIVRVVKTVTTTKEKVRGTTRLFTFLLSPFGRPVLLMKPFARVQLNKIADFEEEYPSRNWWKRSPYRKELKRQMEELRNVILTNGFAT